MAAGGIVSSLDLHTVAKREFLTEFEDVILAPRGMAHLVQFTGPTGTNAVEAALKVARLATGRTNIVAFTNAFHGMSQGSLSVTGNRDKRSGAGLPLGGVTRLPYDGYSEINGLSFLRQALKDKSSGIDHPAAIILELVQGEGGMNVASEAWLAELQKLASQHGILIIVDDIQAGCGRTGRFFSFDGSQLKPDIICLSKSIGGMGLPLSIVLLDPKVDVWTPGQHNGTFRGNNLAFVAATAALRHYWRDPKFVQSLAEKEECLDHSLRDYVSKFPAQAPRLMGRGLMRGVKWAQEGLAENISKACYDRGLLVETCGPSDEVVKLLPPLTVDDASLSKAVDILTEATTAALSHTVPAR
jgi:diaminobutyrate-2-oxoglutarate transaminase